MWEGLARQLERAERANGLPTDGFLGSFAYLPTSSDTGTALSDQAPWFLGGPLDVPLSVATLSNNFLPNDLPRFTGGPPDYLSGLPAAPQSDPANSALSNQSVLFQHSPPSFDFGSSSPDNGDFGPDTRNLTDPGLPLSKSGERFFPPPSPLSGTQAQAQYGVRTAAQLLAPLTYNAVTWQPPPVFAANAAGKLPSPPPLGLAAAIDAASLFFPEGRVARAAEFGLGAAERAAAEAFPELITGPYGMLKGTLPRGWQANHINQSAAFKKLVPHDEGFSVAMRGDVITQPGSPHNIFHRSLEDFWTPFRRDGDRFGQAPTITEYHQAAHQALVASGFTPEQASHLVEQAANQLTSKGVSLSNRDLAQKEYVMQSRTVARIEQLQKVSWFSRVGLKVGPAVAAVSSWPEAIRYCDAQEWEDLQQETLNQCRVYIHQHYRERLQDWNERIQAVKKVAEPLVERKTAAVIRENGLPDIFRITVRFDVVIFCMEAEYDDICPPGFFTRLGAWYLDGHFPCGWWGPFPEGKLIVY